MKSSMLKTFILATTIGATSCAHHDDVRPRESGTHEIKIATERRDEGYQDAMSQADHYCREVEHRTRPVVVQDNTTYVGQGNEDEYNQKKTVAKAAKTVGGLGYVLGGSTESQLGGVVGLGGIVADGVIGNGYVYSMTFKCL